MHVLRNVKRTEELKEITKNTVKRTARRMRKNTSRLRNEKKTKNREYAPGDAVPASRTRTKAVSPQGSSISADKGSKQNALTTKLKEVAKNIPKPSARD